MAQAQTFNIDKLESEIEQSDNNHLNQEVGCGYLGTFKGLFSFLGALPGDIEIEAHPEASYAIARIIFHDVDLQGVSEILDTFSTDIFGAINYNDEKDTADVILVYD